MQIKLLLILLAVYILGCSENSSSPNVADPIDVNIRMEVQILDSTYHLYSRPYTKIYFTTYKLGADDLQYSFEQSETTSCKNGWGVKILNFQMKNEKDKIFLGASCEDWNGSNLRFVEITHDEVLRRIDSTGISNIVKTFAIYYK